jgi:hypothetical protein
MASLTQWASLALLILTLGAAIADAGEAWLRRRGES